MVKFKSYVHPNDRKQGDHTISIEKTLVKSYKDKDLKTDEMLEKIYDTLNKIISDIPDYDSGYLEVEGGEEYEVEHRIGKMPTRFLFYFSATDTPSFKKREIYVESAIEIGEMNLTNLNIVTPTLFVTGDVSGYLRILIWR